MLRLQHIYLQAFDGLASLETTSFVSASFWILRRASVAFAVVVQWDIPVHDHVAKALLVFQTSVSMHKQLRSFEENKARLTGWSKTSWDCGICPGCLFPAGHAAAFSLSMHLCQAEAGLCNSTPPYELQSVQSSDTYQELLSAQWPTIIHSKSWYIIRLETVTLVNQFVHLINRKWSLVAKLAKICPGWSPECKPNAWSYMCKRIG